MYTKQEQLKKNGRLKTQPFKSKEYLSWFHNQGFGCLVCGSLNIEAHHLESGNRGRADNKIVPLCPDHHRGTFSPHGGNAKEFHQAHTKQVLNIIADKLFGVWSDKN